MKVNEQEDYDVNQVTYWYAIDSQWIYDWKMFVQNRRSAIAVGCKKSDIEGVGILDPGPITNCNLYTEFGELKQNLQIERDYRMINENVWKIFYDIYGGGPIMKYVEWDIYSQQLEADEEVKMIEKKIRKCRKVDRKKYKNEIAQFRDKNKALKKVIRDQNVDFDFGEICLQRRRSFESRANRPTLHEVDQEEFGNREASNEGRESTLGSKQVKDAIGKLWTGVMSTIYKYNK
jgi:hypothetical protein